MSGLQPLQTLDQARFETAPILKQLNLASRQLAELKGVVASIPRQEILINTLGIQEAKDSSAIENIVTTHDELYKEDTFPEFIKNAATKEVFRYRQALRAGYELVVRDRLITTNHLLTVQAQLLMKDTGLRERPGTVLANRAGQVVYTPPQDYRVIVGLMNDLERFMNGVDECAVDPLVKMALIHHRFESIHPFYDGNGRTGRILSVLYLVKESLLDIPVLYLSRALVQSKNEYYRLLQAVRERDAWEDWVLYMLAAVEKSAQAAVQTIKAIGETLLATKHRIRANHRFYSQDLINVLFSHPYTKIGFVVSSLGVSRLTATKYLDALADSQVLVKQRIGRSSYYINIALWEILAGASMRGGAE